ncbi:putative membrane protein YccC [Rhizomicrobium palustre]|uniref:Putative membrane protein YccC n=1 Tax=Rhizomicrobium palustre TaxID=189966 RepID=A0A846N2E4_9PROT|nr:FUSC family protein [Rhizomicrobium palustre]NIK89906.1 putative membrane protein YccC [Rhizomicrobium palustre]
MEERPPKAAAMLKLPAFPSILPRLEGERMVDEAECVFSVLLAILFGHLAGVENVSWAAFSGYMVMRGHVLDSLLRGSLRIVGTISGVLIAVLIVPSVTHSLLLASLACAVVGGIALYGALTRKHAYSWLFVGLTFEMILLDKLEAPHHSISVFAETRMLEVAAGTFACVLVSVISHLTARRRWPGKRMARRNSIGFDIHAFRHALQAATALALLPPLGALTGLPQLGQSAISIICVMLVPISSLGVSGFLPVSRRLLHRVAGCLAGASMAAVILLLAHHSMAALLFGTTLGVIIGRHIENGKHAHAYIGTQFTLAVLVTLVPDSYTSAAADPGFGRLLGILLGMAMLEPLLALWHVVGIALGGRLGLGGGEQETTD